MYIIYIYIYITSNNNIALIFAHPSDLQVTSMIFSMSSINVYSVRAHEYGCTFNVVTNKFDSFRQYYYVYYLIMEIELLKSVDLSVNGTVGNV